MSPWNEPVFGMVLTVVVYAVTLFLNCRWNWVHPLFFSAGFIIVFLLATGIPYTSYQTGGDMISFFLGPATVALAIPLVKQFQLIRQNQKGIILGVSLGSFVGILTAGGFALAFGASRDVMMTMIPKSVTTPISIELAKELGGVPGLTAVFTTLAGLIGNLFGYQFLRLLHIQDPVARGLAMGTAAHGIGTAKALQASPLEGGISSLAMALAGICTSLMLIPLYYFFD